MHFCGIISMQKYMVFYRVIGAFKKIMYCQWKYKFWIYQKSCILVQKRNLQFLLLSFAYWCQSQTNLFILKSKCGLILSARLKRSYTGLSKWTASETEKALRRTPPKKSLLETGQKRGVVNMWSTKVNSLLFFVKIFPQHSLVCLIFTNWLLT